MTKSALYLLLTIVLCSVVGCSKGDPELEIDPRELNFGTTQTQIPLSITNTGNEDGIFKSGVNELEYDVRLDTNWLSIMPNSGKCGKEETDLVIVTINRTLMTSGLSTTRIHVNSNGGNGDVIVSATN